MKYLLLLLISAASCSEMEPAKSPEALCVDGWIEDGSYPIVQVSRSLSVKDEGLSEDEIASHMERWAVVKISDGEKTVVLTGMPDSRYFPPYVYRTGELRGEKGKTYTLTVSSGDLTVSSRTTIPECRTEIFRLWSEASSSRVNHYSAFAEIEIRKGFYYRLFVRIGGGIFKPSSAGVYSADDFSWENVPGDSQTVKIPVLPPSGTEEIVLTFEKGTHIEIKLCSMNAREYSYWRDFENVAGFSHSLVLPSAFNLRSNIDGGEGLWAGYSSKIDSLLIN